MKLESSLLFLKELNARKYHKIENIYLNKPRMKKSNESKSPQNSNNSNHSVKNEEFIEFVNKYRKNEYSDYFKSKNISSNFYSVIYI